MFNAPAPIAVDPRRSDFVQWLILVVALILLVIVVGHDQWQAKERVEAEAARRLEIQSLFVAEELQRRFASMYVVLGRLRDTTPPS